MSTRAWMLALAGTSALALGAGVPLLAFSQHTPYTTMTGTVTEVDGGRRVMIHPDPTASIDGIVTTDGVITLHLARGQRIGTPTGSETADLLQPGQAVRARVTTHGEHEARWIRLGP